MNYRHLYHAGNFADVVKHVVLIILIEALQRKESPFCLLDTHAGIGLYPLHSIEAQKKQEYQNGIAKLFLEDKKTMPSAIQKYLSIVQEFNSENVLQFYPGSPAISEQLLRLNDQLILCELHQEDYSTLKNNFYQSQHVAIHLMDAYLSMKAFLPPKEKRGLVLIDPPFEVKNEFEQINHALGRALKHWRSGHYMLWYPIKNKTVINQFYQDIKLQKTPYIMIHFYLNAGVDAGKLSACGLLLMNPPWQVKELLEKTILPYLAEKLNARWEIYSAE